MAKTKKTNKSNASDSNGFIAFLKSETTHNLFGIAVLIFSVFLLLAMVSHIFTWRDNYIFNQLTWGRLFFGDVPATTNFMGRVGTKLAFVFMNSWFGLAAFCLPIIFFVWAFKLSFGVIIIPLNRLLQYCLFLLFWLSISLALVLPQDDVMYGAVGYVGAEVLKSLVGIIGAGLIMFFILITFIILKYKIKLPRVAAVEQAREESPLETVADTNENETFGIDDIFANARKQFDGTSEIVTKTKPVKEVPIKQEVALEVEEIKPIIEEQEIIENTEEPEELELPVIEIKKPAKAIQKAEEVEMMVIVEEKVKAVEVEADDDDEPLHNTIDTPYDPKLDLSSYQAPPLDLLNKYDSKGLQVDRDELEANKTRIVTTLNNFQITIDKIQATIGPTVTLYEIVPAPGTRISRIKNLEDDIALSLAAIGIRIIAPIPGKGTIGIEVPNQRPEMVPMRAALEAEKFTKSPFELPLALGKTISNEVFTANLAKMPHLLIAGATGKGKSVGINSIITSLLYTKHPAELKFVMIDPKKVELTLYSKIERHFLAKLPNTEEAIITDLKKVVPTLTSLCIEMDQRYDLLKAAGVRDLVEYNNKFIKRKLNPNDGHRFLPYIVLVVDEFADMIMQLGKEVEHPIARLAQLARAIGIHLILATQRPSVNVITGTIKANFPARIAFSVTSKIDSRTILDQGGAERLIGRGDMLISQGSDLTRLQCPFISTEEVEAVVEFIGAQRGFSSAYLLPEVPDETGEGNGEALSDEDRDPLFGDAARIIVTSQQGSTSMLQRKLKLGYNRAGRIIDQLEAAGIVGPFEGSKAREVRIKDLVYLEQLLNDLNER